MINLRNIFRVSLPRSGCRTYHSTDGETCAQYGHCDDEQTLQGVLTNSWDEPIYRLIHRSTIQWLLELDNLLVECWHILHHLCTEVLWINVATYYLSNSMYQCSILFFTHRGTLRHYCPIFNDKSALPRTEPPLKMFDWHTVLRLQLKFLFLKVLFW